MMRSKLFLTFVFAGAMTVLSGCYFFHNEDTFGQVPTSPPVEIVTPGPLLDSDSQLARVGWARQPLAEFDLAAVQDQKRLKQWEFYSIVDDQKVVNVTIADIGFIAFCTVETLVFESGKTGVGGLFHFNRKRNLSLPNDSSGEVICRQDGRDAIRIRKDGEFRYFDFSIEGGLTTESVNGSLQLRQPDGADMLAAMIPFSNHQRMFFYENKIPTMTASGVVVVGDQEFDFNSRPAYAVMDWGRGVWPSMVTWRWGGAYGQVDGKPFSFNIGNGFGSAPAGTENLVIVDGVGHKMGRITWSFDPDDPSVMWTFKDDEGRFDLRLEPLYDQELGGNALLLYGLLVKRYGRYYGHVTLDNGSRLELDGVLGFAEQFKVRW